MNRIPAFTFATAHGPSSLSPKGMIDHLKLRQPIYLKTAAYGHFGRPEFAWEQLDATDELQAKAKKL